MNSGSHLAQSRWLFWGVRTLILVFFLIALSRLWWVQVGRGEGWRVQAESNRRQRVTVPAPRGTILDRNGKVLATNQVLWTESYIDEQRQLQERVLSHAQAVEMQATDPARLKKIYQRIYPYGPVTAHLLGYTTQTKTSNDIPQGETGLERFLNTKLRGRNGEVWYERSAQGRSHRVLAQRDPVPGEEIETTLDAELSRVAYEALGDRTGTVLVTTPRGEILVAVSTPSYLPSNATQFSPEETLQEVLVATPSGIWSGNPSPSISAALTDPRSPLLFRVVGGTYPPGSVFKIVTALAGLEREAITASTTVTDNGVLTVGEFTFENWYWRQFGRVEGDVNVVQALARSNDIFFYRLAEWVGPEALAEFAGWLGYGRALGLEGQREQLGIVPSPSWKQEYFGERWFLGNTFHMGIGQGDVLVTPLQVATMMNTVASRGRQCTPHVLATTQPQCQEISLQDESWSLVVTGLRQACSPGGTGAAFFNSPYDVLCKTGTAEFGAEDSRGYRPTHGWFTASVSRQSRPNDQSVAHSSDIVVTVLVESDASQLYREGSRDAAPIAKAVVDAWFAQNKQPELAPPAAE